MPRHIDADKFIERIKESPAFQNMGTDGYFLQCVVLDLLRDFPTADVVPKCEVDKWYHEYHVIKDELKRERLEHKATDKLADKYCAELQTAKTEVETLEKEIERLQNILNSYALQYGTVVDQHKEEYR